MIQRETGEPEEYYNPQGRRIMKYQYPSNVLLINKYFGKIHYNTIVKKEIETINIVKGQFIKYSMESRKHCNLCNDTVVKKHDDRTYSDKKAGIPTRNRHILRIFDWATRYRGNK